MKHLNEAEREILELVKRYNWDSISSYDIQKLLTTISELREANEKWKSGFMDKAAAHVWKERDKLREKCEWLEKNRKALELEQVDHIEIIHDMHEKELTKLRERNEKLTAALKRIAKNEDHHEFHWEAETIAGEAIKDSQ